jgi:hypothetical protein
MGTYAEAARFPLLMHGISSEQMGERNMSAGQRSGTGAKTELDDEKVRKDEILSNRDKAQRPAGQGLDGKGVQIDEYKDNPANRRPPRDENDPEEQSEAKARVEQSDETPEFENVDRPGFDLGGSTGDTNAGKGLGLGDDAKKNRKGWRLPR